MTFRWGLSHGSSMENPSTTWTSSNHDIGWSHVGSFLINSRPKNMFSKFWGVPIFVFVQGFAALGGNTPANLHLLFRCDKVWQNSANWWEDFVIWQVHLNEIRVTGPLEWFCKKLLPGGSNYAPKPSYLPNGLGTSNRPDWLSFTPSNLKLLRPALPILLILVGSCQNTNSQWIVKVNTGLLVKTVMINFPTVNQGLGRPQHLSSSTTPFFHSKRSGHIDPPPHIFWRTGAHILERLKRTKHIASKGFSSNKFYSPSHIFKTSIHKKATFLWWEKILQHFYATAFSLKSQNIESSFYCPKLAPDFLSFEYHLTASWKPGFYWKPDLPPVGLFSLNEKVVLFLFPSMYPIDF